MKTDIENLVRKNILTLKPYSSARNEFKGVASVYLDANENPYGSPLPGSYNRYPDTAHQALRERLAAMNLLQPDQVCIGNGSDELIDQIIRIFCNPGRDEIIVCPPTFKMYETAAAINDVGVKKIYPDEDFQPVPERVLREATTCSKVIFLCSPNNPTGNSVKPEIIEDLLQCFGGIVVLDEAYIHFSSQPSWVSQLSKYDNLIVLQTMSKAWGLAGLRLGIAYAHPAVIDFIMRIKMPYNINSVSQKLGLDALKNVEQVNQWRNEILMERNRMAQAFEDIPYIEKVFPADANFILIRVKDAETLYGHLRKKGIVVRNQSAQYGLRNCLRISIGTPEENIKLIQELINYKE